MATIDQRDNVFTLISVFTVKPENQDTLVNLVIEATNNTMRHLPGFVSTSIHRSPDNTRVVNCAQWRPKANSTPCALIPTRFPHMKAAAALASFDPIECEVAESLAITQIPTRRQDWIRRPWQRVTAPSMMERIRLHPMQPGVSLSTQ